MHEQEGTLSILVTTINVFYRAKIESMEKNAIVGSIPRCKSTVLLPSARLIPGQVACCRGKADGLNVESLAAGDARVSTGSKLLARKIR